MDGRHVFALADTAYATMTQSSKNQVCVISGESGAGKTEAAKSFVKQLVNVSNGAEFEGLENKLLEVNPVLEAFGNAKTKFNDNSSRYVVATGPDAPLRRARWVMASYIWHYLDELLLY